MKELVTGLLGRWGGTVEIVGTDGTKSVKAVLEPVTSQSWQNMRRTIRELGEVPKGQYVYIGPEDISGAQFLRRRGKAFLPRRCQEITLEGVILFHWGLCVPVGEEAAWNLS